MKRNLTQRILRWSGAALCALLLATGQLPAQDAADTQTNVVATADAATTNETAEPSENKSAGNASERNRSKHKEAFVVVGHDAELKKDETADTVVVIGGNATVNGKVHDAVVVIGGSATVNSEVGDAVVAVMGSVNIEKEAVVHGDVVSVGGSVDVAEGATVEGKIVPVDFDTDGLPNPEWLQKWFVQCVLKMRLLAPQVGWVWSIAAIFFLFNALVAVALPRPVQSCVGELTRRPATTFFIGLLTMMLAPIVFLILIATGVGVIVVPFLGAALLFGGIVGKVAVVEYFGFSAQRAVRASGEMKPFLAFLLGSAILTLLYVVPILSLIAFSVAGTWAMGAAVVAAFASMKREAPPKPAASVPPPASTPGGITPTPVMPLASAPMTATNAPTSDIPSNPGFASPNPPPMSPSQGATALAASIPEALVYPRAGFWERMAAGILDVILVGMVIGFAGAWGGPPLMLLIALGYFVGMWTWKGTTIGNIILRLKVVRLDGSPLTFSAALVRGLIGVFSVFVLFLGILWIAWDSEKQGWHDHVAGTVVVRLPRGTPLVVL